MRDLEKAPSGDAHTLDAGEEFWVKPFDLNSFQTNN